MMVTMILFVRLFILSAAATLWVTVLPAQSADLTLFLQKRTAALHVKAVTSFDTSEFTVGADTGLIAKLEQIYDLIERRPEPAGTLATVSDFMDKQYRTVRGLIPFWKDDAPDQKAAASTEQAATLNRLLDEAGALLFDPIATELAIARRIDFVVTQDCLFYPFDALKFDGTPVFLKKSVAYRLGEGKGTPIKASASWRGLIIDDDQTDTEKGADAVATSFPGAFGFDASRVRAEDISGISSVDFILVSADGGVDGIRLKNMVLRPETLSRLKPELVYFDCNLYGLNQNFLNHFHQAGVAAYVAPIFSRQSGQASAETMIRFFRTMLNKETPCQALYLARKTLYDTYRLEGADDLVAMRSAFPFRIYRLN